MHFGKPFKKRKFEIKYEAFYCSEIQLQRLMADKLSCFYMRTKIPLKLCICISVPLMT